MEGAVCSHCPLNLAVPLHGATSSEVVTVVARVTEVLVGAARVPPGQWLEVAGVAGAEWRATLRPGAPPCLPLALTPRQPGLLTLGLALLAGGGPVSRGLVRLRVEAANIQVLTEDGVNLEFGQLPEDCQADRPLVLVNCGEAEVPVHLRVEQPGSPVYSLEGGGQELGFLLPGVGPGGPGEGRGVARHTKVAASTAGLLAEKGPRACPGRLLVGLGEAGATPLGGLALGLEVGRARLRTRRAAEPVLLRCPAGQAVTRGVELANSGNIPLQLRLEVDQTKGGVLTVPEMLTIEPDRTVEVAVTFRAGPQATGPAALSLRLEVAPGGPRHLVALQAEVEAPDGGATYRPGALAPTLSFGVLRKEEPVRQEPPEFTKFPLECDRAAVNFLCVAPGGREEQVVTLRNATRHPVALTAIVRESDLFRLAQEGGGQGAASLTCELQAGGTRELRLLFQPLKAGEARGKLVLKPQGRRQGGKAFKASIGLVGLAGRFQLEMAGVEREGRGEDYRMVCHTFPTTQRITFINQGDMTGFVQVVVDSDSCSGETDGMVEVTPALVLVPRGESREVSVAVRGPRPASLSVLRAPEAARQAMRRARALPGVPSHCASDPALLGPELAALLHGEERLGEEETFGAGRVVTAHDVRHLGRLATRATVRVALPAGPAEFGAMAVEDTLSETRLEQTRVGEPGCHSPPTREDSGVTVAPRLLALARGAEGVVRLGNRGQAAVAWELAWPQSVLQVQPSAGSLAPGGQAVVCVTALPGRGQWRGNVHVYCDNSVDRYHISGRHMGPGSVILKPKFGTHPAVAGTVPGTQPSDGRQIFQIMLPPGKMLLRPATCRAQA
jgi:hypothetical protein